MGTGWHPGEGFPASSPAKAPTDQELTVVAALHEEGRTKLFRARRPDGRSVLLKVLDPRTCRPKDLERLRHEYETAASLEIDAIVRPLGLTTLRDMPALVLEDFSGEPLDRLLATPMPLGTFLDLAVRMARAVARIHDHGIVHKDLKPGNILVDPSTRDVKIADFGIATRLPREQQPARPPGLIEGSLAHMSPEQTGRMNRALDSRSDLYSLGVTFYQMLTARLPFDARDPLEWLHCHIARTPAPPSRLVPGLPEAIDGIVMKLLAKMAEDRYQTARGLEHDLGRCLAACRARCPIEPFPLGERDVPDRLQIPQKLYGRDREIAALLGAYERVADTAVPELVLVSGYSGIGKSSLVHELEKPVVRRKGLFIEGKFDQYKRDVPYSTIVQAFRQLVLDKLLEGEEQIAEWRERLQAALGMNAQLVVGMIPELELLIGPQPPVPELPPAEAQARFRYVFRRFVGAFTHDEHPLALFVDDMQWADPASLGLLHELVTHPEIRSLLVVGAYRDNEVTPAHPLSAALGSARRAGARVTDVVVGPLSSGHLTALVADALHCPPADAEPLGALVLEKTGANPFFVVQFLAVLHRERLIAFDPSAGRWGWDLSRIAAKGFTDNVVELMVGKLRQLPVETQAVLQLAACTEASFDAETLAALGQRAPEAALRAAVEEDLLVQFERAYRFAHDRVQEAAYSLIPEGQRAAVHLEIGRRLLARTAQAELEKSIFEIVNQFDRGAALIASREEREHVAELNLLAGERARRATAHASALKYFAAGAALLAEERWNERYELAFALALHQAECEYLTGALEAAEERLTVLWDRAGNLADLAAVTCLRLDLYTTLDRSDRSVQACLDYLSRVGIHWSPHPTADEVRREYDRIWQQIGDRSIEDLAGLPLMSDPDWRVTMDVLTSLMPPALFTDENLLCLSIGRMANLSLEHGYCDGSSLAYAWLGMILGPYFGDFRAALRFGELSLELVERRGLDRFEARVYLCFAIFVNSWVRHVKASRDLQRRAFEVATSVGDLTFAVYCCNNLVTNLLAAGDPLGEVQREAEAGLAFARNTGFGQAVDIMGTQLRLVRTLRGLTPSFSSFDDEQFDEGRFEQHLEQDPRLAVATCWYWIRKLQARFLAADYASASAAASKAGLLLWTSRPFFELAEYHYYGALARAAYHDTAPAHERPGLVEALAHHCTQLESWARNCPETFQNRYALASAELARIEGRELEAERLYEQAVVSARENGFVQNEAVAYELASRFHRARGYAQIADLYLREARACYVRWEAEGKVRQLERLHPQLLERRTPAPTSTFAIQSEHLDLLSVVKASQTISGEIELDKLVGTLLEIVLEQGGARRGCLILERGQGLCVEAEAGVTGEGAVTRMLEPSPVDSSAVVPSSVVHYAQRTRQGVILDDAVASPGSWASDPYFTRQRPRSVLCLPILRQAKLVGLLYLENDLVAGAFTPDRMTALSLLASQVAISVENARLLSHERATAQALRESEARLNLAQEAAKAGAWEWNPRTNEVHWSEALSSLFGMEPDVRPTYEAWRATIHSDDVARVEHVIQEAARSGTELNLEWRAPGRDGMRWFMSRGRPLRDAGGQVVRYLGISVDVTESKRAEEALREEDRRKGEFLGVLSHELRNPLTPIRYGTSILRRVPPGSGEAARAREIIERQTEHLSRLVDDLLDVTRISRGKIQLDRERLDLRDVVRRTAGDLHGIFEQGQIRLSVVVPPQQVWVDADATRISQALGNLLQNAAKFTSPGGAVSVVLEQEAAEAVARVTDDGEGLEPALLAHLFEPFVQAEHGLARTRGGLGLGLALVKGLVELHGGSVSAASEGAGRGSQFTIRLPLAPGREVGCAGPKELAGGSRSILIIEDNPDAARSLADLVALSGHSVHLAHTGRAGLELARELRPDVVLCDIGLPDIDGYEIARTLRADWALRFTRLIAISGYAQPGDKKRAQEAGFDAHLSKPPPLDELGELISDGTRARG